VNKDDLPAASVSGGDLAGSNVLIIEDQQLVADFFVFFCRGLGLQVLHSSNTFRDGLAAVRHHLPDLVLLDLSLPDGDGLVLAKTVLDELPQTKILAISSHRDPWTMLQVQRLGLHGFVDKNEQRQEVLAEAIRTVLSGRIYYTPVVNESSASLRRNPKAFIRLLSDYEIRILALVGESRNDEEIGALLGISTATVQSRRRDLMTKLEVHTTPKLIHYAIVNGLTRTDHLSPPKPT
jgi:DNA-binding NarL/FixJ family response regulator